MDDKNFASTFQGIIFFLVVLTVTLIGFTYSIGKILHKQQADPVADAVLIEKNIAPLGQVAVAGPPQASGPRSAKQIVESNCNTCHGSGVLGAPKLGSKADWQARLALGVDTILNNAKNGVRAMPAKGGDASLSDDELKAAVNFMLDSVGAAGL